MSSTSATFFCVPCQVSCEGRVTKLRTITNVWRSEDDGEILMTCDNPWTPPSSNTAYSWHCEFNDTSCTISDLQCDKNLNNEARVELTQASCGKLDAALQEAITDILGPTTCDPNFTPNLKIGDKFQATMSFTSVTVVYKPIGCARSWSQVVPLGGAIVTKV
jgi:hypothetical protein